jgi:hypothetical protein
MIGTPASIVRVCRECRREFAITIEEQQFFRDLSARLDVAMTLPARCYGCRCARRPARAVVPVIDDGLDELLVCVSCGVAFIFGGRDKTFFAESCFARPRRCRPCRHIRANGAS